MLTNDNNRSGLLNAGGVISIVAGVLEVIEGSSVLTIQIYGRFFVILGILAIVGGISALKRKSFGLSLAGAICALPLYSFLQPLGMLAVIFVALGKGEFGAERKEMASTGSGRDGLLSAGGILSIVAGITQLISGVSMAVFFLISSNFNHMLLNPILWARWFFLPFLPEAWVDEILLEDFLVIHQGYGFPILWVIIGGCVGVLGILAVVGGVSAIRRKRFGLSLAGAICALISGILGILAVIFVALGKREFGAERKENGI
jgi:hypothetical protein